MNMHDGWTHNQQHAQTVFWQVGNAQFMHGLFSKHTSPMIMHSNQTTYQTIAKFIQQQYYMGNMILP